MTASDLIGYMAATLTTISFVPQAWLTFRTRDVRGISLGMYSVFTVGIALWLAYGWLIAAWPVVIANTITLALAASILAMKVLFRGMPPAADEDAAAEVHAADGDARAPVRNCRRRPHTGKTFPPARSGSRIPSPHARPGFD